jgi:hypothetical protein
MNVIDGTAMSMSVFTAAHRITESRLPRPRGRFVT